MIRNSLTTIVRVVLASLAIALCVHGQLVIADEPKSAIESTVIKAAVDDQAAVFSKQVLPLLRRQFRQRNIGPLIRRAGQDHGSRFHVFWPRNRIRPRRARWPNRRRHWKSIGVARSALERSRRDLPSSRIRP